MKRYIKADYGELSSLEYGKALSEGHKRMQDRYYPFLVSDVYFNEHSASPTGYRITLKGDNINSAGELEWIANMKSPASYSNQTYELYGPFYPNEIQSWSELFRNAPEDASFKSLDGIMRYLFEEMDIDV